MKKTFKQITGLSCGSFSVAVILFFTVGGVAAADWEYYKHLYIHDGQGAFCENVRNDGTNSIFRSRDSGELCEYVWSGSSYTEISLGSSVYDMASGNGKNDGNNYFYGTAGKNLYEFEWTGSSWTTAVLVGTGTLSMTDVAVGNAMDPYGTDQQVYGANDDGHVYVYNWTGTGYEKTIAGTTTASINAIAVGSGWKGGSSSVYAVTFDSHVYQFRWDGSSWKTLIIDTAPAALSDIAIWDESGDEKIFAACEDGHVYQYQCIDANFSWARTDLGDTESSVKKISIGAGRSDGVTRIYSIGGYCHEFTDNSGTWSMQRMNVGEGGQDDYLVVGNMRGGGITSVFVNPAGFLREFIYDGVAPSTVTISAVSGELASVDLTWLSPGDDGTVGITQGSSSTFRIDYTTYTKSWDYSSYQIDIATVTSYGDVCSYTVDNLLDSVTYYFCVWTCDNVGNWSGNSNISTATAGALSGTYVYDDIDSDTTWTEANSPYIINTNLTINSGVTLTIEPGVEVKFRGDYKITNKGFINAQGT
ncbi:MAG: fibronectin type III domain-containing protein, partial [Elusimicrobia bacterium]|nr:fibronectin type III domain-containing protein [Elusimicrobiota bacterium]